MTPVKIIDVFGQFDNKGTDHYYIFNNGTIEFGSADRKYFNDPRELPSAVNRAYATFCTPSGWWLSLIAHNPHDSRHGFAMVSVSIGANRPTDGRQAVALLDTLFQQLVVDRKWSDTDTKAILDAMPLSVRPTPLKPNNLAASQGRGAFRAYSDEKMLADYMSAILQSEYDKFARVFFVSEQESGLMRTQMPSINSPFRKVFIIETEDQEHTKVSKQEAFEGETLEVIYSYPGAADVKKNFKVGEMSAVAIVEGSRMIVNNATKANANFTRRIYLEFKGGVRARLENAESLRAHGISYNNLDGSLDLPMKDSGKPISLIFLAEGYNEKKITIEADKVKNGDRITVAFEAKAVSVVFSTPAGEFKADRQINMNSPEYRTLIQQCGAIVQQGKLIVKAGSAQRIVNRHDYDDNSDKGEKIKFYAKIGALVAVILLLAAAAYFVFFSEDKNDDKAKDKDRTEQTEDKKGKENNDNDNSNENGQDQKDLESADLGYLADNNIWKFDELQSDKFKNFANGLKEAAIPDGWQEINNAKWKAIMEKYNVADETIKKIIRSTIASNSKDDILDIPKVSKDLEIVEPGNNSSNPETAKSNPAEELLKTDIEYMKKYDAWERSKLKSEEALAFFDALALAASPAEIASLRYPSSSTVNGYWITLQQNCKKIKGANEIEKFSASFKTFVSQNKIDLKQLSSASANALKKGNGTKENIPGKNQGGRRNSE